MMSFRVEDAEAEDAQRWAHKLGIDRSELLREALHRHLVRLAAEHESPISESEMALASSAEWGPAEDWSDWSDAAG
jgi:hypothetical protein